MRIECKREIETQCYEVLMEIGMEEYRPDIISVLKLAEERGGIVSPKEISDHLLGKRPESVGEQIIIRLQDYGLLEGFGQYNPMGGRARNASLTDLGRETASEDFVMMPERAIYRIWITDDPLVPNGMVAIERIKATRLKDDINGLRNHENGNGSSDELVSMDKIRFIEGSKHRILMGTDDFPAGSNVHIFKLEDKGRKAEGATVKPEALLEIKPDGMISLNIGMGNNKISLTAPRISQEDIIREVAYALNSTWTGEFIDADFSSLDKDARKNFMIRKHGPRELPIGTVDNEDLDRFSVTVHAVPVDTTDIDMAEEWALWLLKENIHGYLTTGEYSDLVKEVSQRFRRVHNLELPDQVSLAGMAKQDDNMELFWYLQTPIDLNPMGVTE